MRYITLFAAFLAPNRNYIDKLNDMPNKDLTARKIVKIVESQWQGEGRGARVRRSIGRQELRNLDPFLMLDEFSGNGAEGAGFPDHPHREFETVSYLLEGHFIHEDFTGRLGHLYPGDLQWMTAGKGIVHSEMPGKEPTKSHYTGTCC